ADDVAAELDYDPRLRQRALCPFHYFPHAVADGGDIERLLAGKVRDAESAAYVEQAHGRGCVGGEPRRQLDGLLLGLADRLGPQVLRSAEDVEALEVEAELPDPAQHLRNALRVDAELLGSASHLHSGAFQLEIGVDPYRDERTPPAAYGRDALHLALGLEVAADARRHRLGEVGVGLAGPGEADRRRFRPGSERDAQLAGRRYVQAVDERRDVLHHRWHRVRFHRVMQVHVRGNVPAQ